MPPEQLVKRTLRNKKKSNHPILSDLSQLNLADEWSTTGEPNHQRFLLYDNKNESDERIIIFATDECLRYLAESDEWYMDGNFTLAPTFFQQLYVIRVQVRGIFITAVFCLLQNKSQKTYENVFNIILEKCANINLNPCPSILNIDFEKAVINAAKNILGNQIKIQGCFYHLCQSTHRKIQSLGLEKHYRENQFFSTFCRMLDGLAFLPVNDVPKGLLYLKSIMPQEANELMEYFDSTYIGGRIINNNNTRSNIIRRTPAAFPPSVWNVHEVTLNDGQRTNNQTEGWNHRFSKLVNRSHPSIWLLIEKMRLELGVDEVKIGQRDIGQPPAKKKKMYVDMQEKLKKICEEYNNNERSIENFLKCISLTFINFN